MAVRQYVGARYVPVFADPVQWSDTRTYEPLTMVQNAGETYMSRQHVPAGIQLPSVSTGEESNDYWVHMSNWNAQVEGYREEVLRYAEQVLGFDGRIEANSDAISDFNQELGQYEDTINATLPSTEFTPENTVSDVIAKISEDFNNDMKVKAFSFETVIAMKTSEVLFDGAICHTNGYHSANDGGGAWYIISDNGIANEIDIIACQNSLNANLVYSPMKIDIDQFGIVGDGIADDYSRVQRAFDVLADNGIVYFSSNKKIRVSDTLILNKPYATLKGNYAEYFVSLCMNNTDTVRGTKYILEVTASGISIDGIQFRSSTYGENIDNPRGVKFIIENGINPNVDANIYNCSFVFLREATYCMGRNLDIYNTVYSNCLKGSTFRKSIGTDANMRGWKVRHCDFHSMGSSIGNGSYYNGKNIDDNDYWCIDADYDRLGKEHTFEHCYFEYNDFHVSKIPFYKGFLNGVIIRGNNFAADGLSLFIYGNGEPSQSHQGLIEGNFVNNLGSYTDLDNFATKHHLILNNAGELQIRNNIFQYCLEECAYLTGDCRLINFISNTFFNCIFKSSNYSLISWNTLNASNSYRPVFIGNTTRSTRWDTGDNTTLFKFPANAETYNKERFYGSNVLANAFPEP